jgi:Zn-dependent M28 family amino/carboxypeptidase
MRDVLLTQARAAGLPAESDEDTSTYGQGDYEPFALAGFPAAWVEWVDDPTYHTTEDTAEHVEPALLQQTGDMLRAFLMELDKAALDRLLNAGG